MKWCEGGIYDRSEGEGSKHRHCVYDAVTIKCAASYSPLKWLTPAGKQ